MKKIIIFVTVIVVFCMLSGCGKKASVSQDSPYKNVQSTANDFLFSFQDDTGSIITLDKKPKKTAVLFSSFAQMVLLSGAEVGVTVGEAVERGFAQKDTPIVDSGAGKRINAELLAAYKPDFIIGSYDIDAHVKAKEALKDTGVPFALFRVESFDDYARVMEILCRVSEREDLYEKNVVQVKKEIQDCLSKIDKSQEKKNILFVRCASSAKATKAKTKKESFVCGMLEQMNTHNIAEDVPLLLDGVSAEYIIEKNPDYIFFSTMGDRQAAVEYMQKELSKPEWQVLDAVKKNNYAFLPKELFQYKPNNRWGEAYKYLAELLYGEKDN